MTARAFILLSLLLIALLAGCRKDDPQAALEAAVKQLQDNLQNKRTSAVLEQLTTDFRTEAGDDRNWARQTMMGLFLRYQNIRIYAPSKRSWLDSAIRSRGFTEASVGISGAEGLLPDSARLYQVRLEWRLEDGKWRLSRLAWQ